MYPEFNEIIISRKFECEQRQNDLAIHTHKTFVNDEKVWVLGLYNWLKCFQTTWNPLNGFKEHEIGFGINVFSKVDYTDQKSILMCIVKRQKIFSFFLEAYW